MLLSYTAIFFSICIPCMYKFPSTVPNEKKKKIIIYIVKISLSPVD